MITSSDHLEKLDGRLAQVLGSGYSPEQKIPVAIGAAEKDFELVIAAVMEQGGSIRHVLPILKVVSAWVPIQSVGPLADMTVVQEIELDQRVHIA
jgi:hypothetical protein